MAFTIQRGARRPAMPYMDAILSDRIADGDAATMWLRDIHWGYWSDPTHAGSSFAEYARAAQRMTDRVCTAAGIGSGMRVLDCGCGLGGTVASMNERCSSMDLVGLNIDPRQLAVARSNVTARTGNAIQFVQGDACELPFPDSSFDAVTAVECIFHFPGRRRFLKEASRVLRPSGRLMVSDYVPRTSALPLLLPLIGSIPFFGDFNPLPAPMPAYRRLARTSGLRLHAAEDVTRNTLPSYPVLEKYFETVSRDAVRQGRVLARASRRGLLRYMILAFTKD
jgi:ubiquinone/menaquinone biosynthesis C-methylase UbiE